MDELDPMDEIPLEKYQFLEKDDSAVYTASVAEYLPLSP